MGERKGLLDELIKQYKYNSVRGIGKVLAGLVAEVIPSLDGKVIVIPLPTIRKHIRARGFDHTLVMAKKLARFRGWKCQTLLMRKNEAIQVGASAEQRKIQAQGAYSVASEVDENAIYLLLDDVWTTGASMCAGMNLLRKVGAKNIYGTVVGVSLDTD